MAQNRNSNAEKIPFVPGQVGNFVDQQQFFYGGSNDKWKDYYKAVNSPTKLPTFNWEGHGRGNKGKNGDGKDDDPGTGTGTDGGRPDVANPHGKMTMVGQMPAQMAAQMPTQGFLGIPGATGQQLPPTMGLLQRGPANGAQFQLPPEILAMMARR